MNKFEYIPQISMAIFSFELISEQQQEQQKWQDTKYLTSMDQFFMIANIRVPVGTLLKTTSDSFPMASLLNDMDLYLTKLTSVYSV